MTDLTANGKQPTDATKSSSVIGVWATASRRKVTIRGADGHTRRAAPGCRCRGSGNPLFNEVIVPMVEKDGWNAVPPTDDKSVRQVRRASPSSPACCRCSSRASSRTWPR